jgi:cytochrome c-type biogenesis protein
LVTAWLLTAATSRLKKLNRYMPVIERVSGAFIIIVGVLLLTGSFTYLNTVFNQFTPEWLLEFS